MHLPAVAGAILDARYGRASRGEPLGSDRARSFDGSPGARRLLKKPPQIDGERVREAQKRIQCWTGFIVLNVTNHRL